jgi:gluconolactonase
LIFVENLGVPEGPVVLDDGSWLVVEVEPQLGPDDNLYANETFTSRKVFGNVRQEESTDSFSGPDGMAFRADGNLYVAVYGQGDVTVLSPSGDVVGRIETAGSLPTNVAFGLEEQRIYVTEDEFGRVATFGVGTEGLRLYA